MTTHFTETFDVEPSSTATDLTPAQVGGVTRRLREAAKDAGHSLGPTEITEDVHEIGVRRTVIARAPVVGPYEIGAEDGTEGLDDGADEKPDED